MMPSTKIINQGQNRLILCEGMDAVGKTSTITKAITLLNQDYQNHATHEHYSYSKGLRSKGIIGAINHMTPSTLTLLLELYVHDKQIIRPLSESGESIIMDRGYGTIITYHTPTLIQEYCKKIYDKIYTLLTQPVVLVYFETSLEERMKRLYARNDFNDRIFKDPTSIIIEREQRMRQWYESFSGKKQCINTTEKSVEESALQLYELIRK